MAGGKIHGSALAPGFLIASPPLGDPNFDRSVVLLALHGDEGALGFVVNRPAPLRLGELLPLAGYGDAAPRDPTRVWLGGPVQPSSAWILGLSEELPPLEGKVIEVGARLRVTSSQEAFDAMANEARERVPNAEDPKRRLVILGYSGWAPGQLEGEIAAGAWLPVPLDEALLFEVDVEKRWEAAYALLGLTPAFGMSMRHTGDA